MAKNLSSICILLILSLTIATALKMKVSQADREDLSSDSLFPSRSSNRTSARPTPPEIDISPIIITPIEEEEQPSPRDTEKDKNEIYAPPFYNDEMPNELMRVIPINFWHSSDKQSRIKNFVALKNKDDLAVSCDISGMVNLTPFNKTGDNFDHLWIPEEVGENIIRLRSYNGGYLEYDMTNDMFMCSNRLHNFRNTFHVFLSDRDRMCLLLKGPDMRFVSHIRNNLMYRNLTSNLDDFCFYGEKKPKIDMKDIWFSSSSNLTDFMGGEPGLGGMVREHMPRSEDEGGIRATSTMRGSSFLRAGNDTEAATTDFDISIPPRRP